MARRKKIASPVSNKSPITSTEKDKELLKELEKDLADKQVKREKKKPKKPTKPKAPSTRTRKAKTISIPKPKSASPQHIKAVKARTAKGYPKEIAELLAPEFRKQARKWDKEHTAKQPVEPEETETISSGLSEEVLSQEETAAIEWSTILYNLEHVEMYLGHRYSREGLWAIRSFLEEGYYTYGDLFLKELEKKPEWHNLASVRELYETSRAVGYATALVNKLYGEMFGQFGLLTDELEEE